MQPWSLNSWTAYPYSQGVEYPDAQQFQHVIDLLGQLPPLVSIQAIECLKNNIGKAAHKETFIIQGGDCAESFEDCRLEVIHNKLKILQQMSALLSRCITAEIIQMGRIAGQYAKARSSEVETQQGITLKSYCGDLINQPAFTESARKPNPYLLLEGYTCASKTIDIIKAIQEDKQDFYTSHEALHLPFEQALTRYDYESKKWYLLSTHLPWVGVRTNQLDSAHLEFLRGIANPVGIKVGPDATCEWLYAVLHKLNPLREEGKILLITRMGAQQVNSFLPPLIQMVQEEQFPVTWSCDPMHGNTEMTENGFKTRHFDNLWSELKQTLLLHHEFQSHLGGIHLELTGEPVTECIGGSRGLSETDLTHAYFSLVDPRLNYEQSLEIAMRLGLEMKKSRVG